MDEMNYMEDGSLDYHEAQEKVIYILDNISNIDERRRDLDELCMEFSSNFKGNYRTSRTRKPIASAVG